MASQSYSQSTLAPIGGKPKKKKPHRPANQTVGGSPSARPNPKARPANQNAGNGVAHDKPLKFKWPNGSMHSRPFHGHGGSGGGPGGPAAPTRPPAKPVKHPLVDQANALADLRYGGAESSLNAQSQAIAPWYQNYMNEQGAAATAQQAYANPLVAQAQQRATDSGEQAPGLDPSTPAGHDAALAAAARNALGQAFVTTLQGVNQTQKDFYQGQKAVAGAAEVGAQTDVARRKADLQKEKGAYVASTVQDLRQTRHKNRLENAAFGLDVTKANTDAANTAADNRRQNRRDRQTRQDKQGEPNKYGFTDKEWRSMSTAQRQREIHKYDNNGGTTGKPDFTPQQVSKSAVQLRKGVSAIKRALEGKTTAPTDFWNKAYNDLLDAGYDPLMARAAIQTVRQGHAGGGIAKRLKRDYGLTHLPRMKPMKKPPAYVLRPPPQAPGANGQNRPT